ncbi:translation initiation factor Sui1 [Marinospirillum perlucidum]|uniref:translation initiation factor Sui1 n=1 Tax=Marinospirillum perlucidum TaxID=1982602 RepID=UPI000DF1CC07|nr:translation initiation factor Sui1 [Marinospirillum perlucidum]
MASMQDQLRRLVYSTEQGDICPACQESKNACRCDELADTEHLQELDGIVRIRRETSGRKGKGVTTITGVPLPKDELKQLAASLKKRCGTGGALKDRVIEIQGDQRQLLRQLLEDKGFKVKLAGG